ncbi:hypothetical protein XACLE3_6330016 [Xanthomonas citri pv. citri]|nr:hypothetical protein XACLE3_6330016 [Xanthomonas citri pv. citri]
MIVDVKPRVADVISQVWRTLAVLFVWDVLITIIYYVLPFRAPALPLTIFGSALALFLGFRANSTYQRWWEGRVLWGQMINASRNLVRLSVSILSAPEAGDLGRTIALRQIAYVNALRCQLRRLPVAGGDGVVPACGRRRSGGGGGAHQCGQRLARHHRTQRGAGAARWLDRQHPAGQRGTHPGGYRQRTGRHGTPEEYAVAVPIPLLSEPVYAAVLRAVADRSGGDAAIRHTGRFDLGRVDVSGGVEDRR